MYLQEIKKGLGRRLPVNQAMCYVIVERPIIDKTVIQTL